MVRVSKRHFHSIHEYGNLYKLNLTWLHLDALYDIFNCRTIAAWIGKVTNIYSLA